MAGTGWFGPYRIAVSSANPSLAYVSANEFAHLRGLFLSTVRRYLKSGLLPNAQPGGPRYRVLIPRDALDAFRRNPDAVGTEPEDTHSETPCAPHLDLPSRRSGPVPRWLRQN